MKQTKKRIAIIDYLGTNCQNETIDAVNKLGYSSFIFSNTYNKKAFPPCDGCIIPGGFSYGDYIRTGVLAANDSVVSEFIIHIHNQGLPILGICNGFQILCEMNLLPGVLLRNELNKFINKDVIVVDSTGNPYRLPVAHKTGRYFNFNTDLSYNVWLKYTNNINGSVDNIAGIEMDNIYGMMPHPERAIHKHLVNSNEDGLRILKGVFNG